MCPIVSLEVESFIAPLGMRRKMLVARLFTKLCHRPEGDEMAKILKIENGFKEREYYPLRKCFITSAPEYLRLFHTPICKRVKTSRVSKVPPWFPMNKYVFSEMDNYSCVSANEIFKEMVQQKYKNYDHVYTDGSKVQTPELSTSCGIYIERRRQGISWKIDPRHSVLGTELFAIRQALCIIKIGNRRETVLFTDSCSSTQMILAVKSAYKNIVEEIRRLIADVVIRGNTIKIQWVKAHCNITGNEMADRLASLGHNNNKSACYALSVEEHLSIGTE